MALEPFYSRLAALRNQYALSIGPFPAGELPPELLPYYSPGLRVELRALYEDGKESRRQFLFKDGADLTWLIAVLSSPEEAEAGDEAGTAEPEESGGGTRGFIELYDENQLITEVRQIMGGGSEYITRYSYRNRVLVRAETEVREILMVTEEETTEREEVRPVSTDQYRYTRSGALRLVERVYHRGEGEDEVSRFNFPALSPNPPVDPDFVRPALAYSSEFLQDIAALGAYRVLYATDDRGRVLGETRQDEAGKVIGELRNTWSGDRLTAVEWKAGEDERRAEYEYSAEGDRIVERDYRKGNLERLVRREGNRELEELYMNGALILTAVWEDGRKISEERVRGGGSR
jgi:hypothetical protein